MPKKVTFTKTTKFYGVEYKKGDTIKVSSETYKVLQGLGCTKDYKKPTKEA